MKASEDLMKHDDSSVGVNKASSPGGLILWKSARSAGEDSICVFVGVGGIKAKTHEAVAVLYANTVRYVNPVRYHNA